jgi:hypothetical protein
MRIPTEIKNLTTKIYHICQQEKTTCHDTAVAVHPRPKQKCRHPSLGLNETMVDYISHR